MSKDGKPMAKGWQKAIQESHYMPVCLVNSKIIVTLEWTSYGFNKFSATFSRGVKLIKEMFSV
jgi:hypothetical protein